MYLELKRLKVNLNKFTFYVLYKNDNELVTIG